jgi:hypothetical protein
MTISATAWVAAAHNTAMPMSRTVEAAGKVRLSAEAHLTH